MIIKLISSPIPAVVAEEIQKLASLYVNNAKFTYNDIEISYRTEVIDGKVFHNALCKVVENKKK